MLATLQPSILAPQYQGYNTRPSTRKPLEGVPTDIIQFSAKRIYDHLSDEQIQELAKQATSTGRTGPSTSDRVPFELITSHNLSNQHIETIQALRGYHPAGYGCFSITRQERPDGQYHYRWACSASCD